MLIEAAAPVGRRRTQMDRSAETRSQLVKAAGELLESVGFAGTTTAAIAMGESPCAVGRRSIGSGSVVRVYASGDTRP
jgi:L-2-hydroxyglutarate oxidase LhgO